MTSEKDSAATRPESGELTHAGGVVVFSKNLESPSYLLLAPSNGRREWVLPKGHIEPGESPQEAALREVREEAGVRSRILARLADESYLVGLQRVHMAVFLLEKTGELPGHEDREQRWCGREEAFRCLSFASSRASLRQAVAQIEGHEAARALGGR